MADSVRKNQGASSNSFMPCVGNNKCCFGSSGEIKKYVNKYIFWSLWQNQVNK